MIRRYQLSAAMQAFVAETEAHPLEGPTLDAQRENYERMAAAFAPPVPPGLLVRDLHPEGLVELRLYHPEGAPPAAGWPTVFYIHGGGWVLGNARTHDMICIPLAVELGALVVALSYRLAPEHPYPAALNDCLNVWRWLQKDGLGEPVDKQRIAVAGDSGGGNLAAALCLALRASGEPLPKAQALIYPALGDTDSPSHTRCADAPLMTSAAVGEYLAAYLPSPGDRRDPLALPLLAEDFDGLPPAFIGVAEFDPLCDDGGLYRDRLRGAGVPVDYFPGPGLVHGCLRGRDVPEVVDLRNALIASLRRTL
ncbi:alpha/beta hydrolase [Pseudomonas sp. CAN2814]|uniref:alpha/beta hydrolase n=1 Tax=Pseudomonas sp. CAN1 TaxID=3046726 RepID=UPI002647E2AA|nr:alpha/beta hydrolase [Pseudomonas sp. CAN1]MDN6855403.1 alpha/beta hydrolase [Pseudomonas sp. CAN1]